MGSEHIILWSFFLIDVLIECLFWLRLCGLGNTAQLVELLPSKPEALGLIPSTVCRDTNLYSHHLEDGEVRCLFKVLRGYITSPRLSWTT